MTTVPLEAVTTTTAPDAAATSTTVVTTTTAPPVTTTTMDPGALIEVEFSAGDIIGSGRFEVPLGETVTIRVTSDVAEEIHVHGYDLTLELVAGTTGELTFVADIPGVFEVELERSHLPLFDLEVGG